MAIAFDASTSATQTGDSATFSHTCTGTDLVLIVAITCGSSSYSFSGSDTMTYNSVAMTFIAATSDATRGVGLWYLVNPSTGSNTVQFTGSSSFDKNAFALSYTGASQTSPVDSGAGSSGNGTAVTLTTTVVASGCWLVGFVVDGNQSFTAGTGTTERNEQTDSSGNKACSDDSNGTVSTGSQSLNVTIADTRDYVWRVMSLAPKRTFSPITIMF